MTRLVAFLLEREETLYEQLTTEHIFGCLIDKRLRLLSSAQLAKLNDILNVWPFIDARNDNRPIPNLFWDWENGGDPVYNHVFDRLTMLYGLISKYQIDLRDLFEYRQIMEWPFHDLWDQLYVTVSGELGITAATVDEFLEWTTNGYLASGFLSVHPTKKGDFGDLQCLICLDQLETVDDMQGRTIAKLKCGHFYHIECVIPHWDQFNHWTNTCPTCRQPAGPMREMFDQYTAEQVDVDYEVTHGASGLHEQEAEMIQDSLDQPDFESRTVGVHIHEGYWQRHIWTILEQRRAAREASRPPDKGDNQWYGA